MDLPLAHHRWQPGTWAPWLFGPTAIVGAAVTCPNGHAFSIGGGTTFGSVHTIGSDGTVLPSVVCPRCAWHVFVRLTGWGA